MIFFQEREREKSYPFTVWNVPNMRLWITLNPRFRDVIKIEIIQITVLRMRILTCSLLQTC